MLDTRLRKSPTAVQRDLWGSLAGRGVHAQGSRGTGASCPPPPHPPIPQPADVWHGPRDTLKGHASLNWTQTPGSQETAEGGGDG